MTFLDLTFALLALTAAAPGQGPEFVFPVDCEPGKTCLIQKYFDHDPAAGRSDFRCGKLTTDGHDGTDIRVRTMADLRQGVRVFAAKAGTVVRIRDGEPDVGVRARAIEGGKDAGNAVVIDHGGGWETQYSHLRQGSLKVRPGQKVTAGEPIALIGLSGNSEYPHLHFTVRSGRMALDPFLPLGGAPNCHIDPIAANLWDHRSASRLAYAPAGVIAAGLASVVPPRGVTERDPAPGLDDIRAPIILWADVFGARAGDQQEFAIVAPGGGTLHRQVDVIEDGGLSWFAYSGKRPTGEGWAKGRYTGRYRLLRGDRVVGDMEVIAVLR